MSRDVQRVGSEPVRTPGPGRDPRSISRPTRLATVIGNRAMQRLAAGAAPAALPGRTRTLQRDTPKDETLKDDSPDPKSGWWVKFQGSHSPLGGWLPLGGFSFGKGTDGDDVDGYVDILVGSPKGLHLGTAFDTSAQVTLLIEQRSHEGKPIRQPAQKVVITSLEIKTTYDLDDHHRIKTTGGPHTRIRVGVSLVGTAADGH